MPVIDNDSWLEFAKQKVLNAIETHEKAADKLDTFLQWTWLIYTSIFTLGSLLSFIALDNIYQQIFLVLPIVVIMISRYYCTDVSMPGSEVVDLHDVQDIMAKFIDIVNIKKKKLKKARIATLISIFTIILALFGYNNSVSNKDIKVNSQNLKLKNELLKEENNNYEYQFNSLLNQKKLQCIQNNDTNYLKILKMFEK